MLRAAFSRSDLTILVRTRLEIVLDSEVSTEEGWRVVVFNFIDGLNRQERVADLLPAVREARPKDRILVAFCDQFLGQTNGTNSGEVLRQAAGKLYKQFKDRTEKFGFLRAYKELHDVLHGLQSYLPTLRTAVAARIAKPDDPQLDDAIADLKDLLDRAQKAAPATEKPDAPPLWIGRFATAVNNLTDPAKANAAVNRLGQLPSQDMSKLNAKLIEYAEGLKAEELIRQLDEIRTVLVSRSSDPGVAPLRLALERFREPCAQLVDLTRVHNLCQNLDDALREARGLPSTPAGELQDWPEAKKYLEQLGSFRPTDRQVKRTVDAGRAFDSGTGSLATLDEKLDNLFTTTDGDLLKVTSALPAAAWELQTSLENFQ
jgi:hypothetical protein